MTDHESTKIQISGYSFEQRRYLPEETNNIAEIWKNLEQCGNKSFFLSWFWIEAWLKTMQPNALLLTVFSQNQVIATGLLVITKVHRRGFPVTQLRLHQTGDPEEDQIWTEYNEFLIDDSHRETLYPALMQYLKLYVKGWDELIIGAVEKRQLNYFSSLDLRQHELWQAPAYSVDLSSIKSSGKNYLETLSRNTRYQIRRAIKRLNSSSPIQMERATSVEEAGDFFNAIGPLHMQRWGNTASGYSNPKFVGFHQTLIKQSWPAGTIDVIRFTANDKVFAYIYNFIYRDQVFFYMSGIDYVNSELSKPGLIAHALCIQHYIDSNKTCYDFLGGDSQYKRSLGSHSGTMSITAFQKHKTLFLIEAAGRTIKQWIHNFKTNM